MEVAAGTNPNATDTDGDGVNDFADNCPLTPNPDQKDSDGDLIGDACDTDADNDGVPDKSTTDGIVFTAIPVSAGGDNAPLVYNPDQLDSDGDGIPNVLDNCPAVANPLQTDTDGDGIGDACDTDTVDIAFAPRNQSTPPPPDGDGDGVPDASDNCPSILNADQKDTDGDGIGDACDTDADNDGVADKNASFVSIPPSSGGDNCPLVANPNQADLDGDGIGDACDPDADGDGFIALAKGGTDCNDLDAAVNPNRTEVQGNGKDDDCNPATPDTPFGIVFSLVVTNAGEPSTPAPGNNLDTWLPTDGAQLTVTATVVEAGGAAISPQPDIGFSVCATCVTALPGKYTNDPNVADTSPDFTYVLGANTINVTSHDFGGSITFHAEAAFNLDDGTPIFVQSDLSLPKDANGNQIADAWEALYGGNLDKNADSDTSTGSALIGDGLSVAKEYRGFRWGPELVSQLIGRPGVATYQTAAYTPTGPTRHFRTNPTRKTLFVKYTGFDAANPFALGAALLNNGIDVYVRDLASADPGELNIDVALMTNSTGSFGFEDGRINKRGLRDWSFDTKGSCGLGTQTAYGSCQAYQEALAGYFNDRPYKDAGTTLGTAGQLDAINLVEDANDNATDDKVGAKKESATKINNTVLDGDLWVNNNLFNQQLSTFDIDNNGYVELPVAGSVSSINRDFEYTRQQVLKHTITHELTHSLGAVHDTDSACLMYEYSNNWSRDGCLSNVTLGAIMFHNQ